MMTSEFVDSHRESYKRGSILNYLEVSHKVLTLNYLEVSYKLLTNWTWMFIHEANLLRF